MASEHMDEITTGYSAFKSLFARNLEDSLEQNICHTQAVWAQISTEMSRLQEEPTQQATQTNQVPSLQDNDQELAEIIEEKMAHKEQVSVLSQIHLQQAEEVKAQSQEIWHLLALVEKQQKAIKQLTSPKSPAREPRTTSSCPKSQLDVMRDEISNLIPNGEYKVGYCCGLRFLISGSGSK